MDGTLIDSNHYLDTITERFFRKRNVAYTRDFLNATKSMSKTAYCKAVKELTNDPGSLEEIDKEVSEYMMDIYRYDVQLMPGALPLLKKLRDLGIKLCVASATDAKTVRFVLERLQVLDYFEFVISCDEVGKDKDHADIFLKAAEKLGSASPEDVMVFEDSLVAIRTARNAGFPIIGMYDPDETSKEELSGICDVVITDFNELI